MDEIHSTPSQKRLKEVLIYASETGVFTWRVRRGRQAAGTLAGKITTNNYLMIGVDGRSYLASRLAWVYEHGTDPGENVDHKDGNTLNNRINNLRSCTHSQNQKNMRKHRDNTSGFKGAYWHKGANKWMSQIYADGKFHYLGLFSTAEEAASVYNDAAKKHHDDFAHLNREGR